MQLLEHFKELTLHPKNAEELKGLILQLAVQGRLTRQWRGENPDVEPASVLLEKIEEEKKQLIQAKQIRKEKPLDPIDSRDIIPNIPNTWEMIKLGEIGDWGAGATPSRSRSDYYDGNINWFKSGELNNGIIDYNSEETINELAIKNSSLRLNKIGDVLIAMYGATIGKTGILAVEGTTNQAVCACTPFSCITNVYLHLLLKALKGKFINQGEGGAQPNISRVKIRNQAFALPPLAEQKAIVAIVNQLFAEVEQLENLTKERIQLKSDFVTSALNQLTQATESEVASHWELIKSQFGTFFTEKENIKKLREAVLQLAVQGKLTHHWRAQSRLSGVEVEPASILLEKIKAEKEQLIKAGKIKKEKPLPPISAEEIPYELPEGWIWCRLKGLGQISGGGTPSKSKSIYWDGDIPWVSPKDMKSDFIETSQDMITQEAVANSSTKLIPIGSLLIVGRSGILKRTIPISINLVECTVNQDMKVVSPFLTEMNIFIRLALKGMEKTLLKDYVKYGMTVHSLKYTEFELLPVPLPTLEEQKAIVEKVNGLMALCDQLEQEIETHQTTQEEWMQSCLRGGGVER